MKHHGPKEEQAIRRLETENGRLRDEVASLQYNLQLLQAEVRDIRASVQARGGRLPKVGWLVNAILNLRLVVQSWQIIQPVGPPAEFPLTPERNLGSNSEDEAGSPLRRRRRLEI